MNDQIKWLGFVLAFVIGVAGSLGCATMAASEVANSGSSDFYYKPAQQDEIVAIGKPDAALAKEMGQEKVVAFIGLKNTYLLHKGGEELEKISQLKLAGRNMQIDAARSRKLLLQDKQVWGEVKLTYTNGGAVSAEERAELEQAGFVQLNKIGPDHFQRKVDVEGIVYPPIKISEAQLEKLGTRRPISLFNSKDAKPPLSGRMLKYPLIAAGVAADIVLLPVYAIGLGVVVIGLAAN